jgi:putative membrane protein
MNVYKGVAAGVAGGLVASYVMNQFQSALGKLMENEERSHGAQSLQQGSPEHGIGRELAERGVDEPDDDAAARTGNAVSELVFDHHLTKSEKETVGAVAHYAMGVTSGAIYGAVAEMMPVATTCEGTAFGAAVWLMADEGVVPALGLSRNPTDYPPSIHVYSFTSHLVYGLTTELVRRAVRRAL